MQVQGSLAKIHTKSGTGKNGKPWTAYRLGVDTGKGELEWFGYGFKAPTVNEGSVVEFDAEEGKYGADVVEGTLKLIKKDAPAAKKFKAAANNKDDSIVRQSSTGYAIEVVRTMIENDLVPIPAKAKRYDWYLELLEEVTDRIFVANRDPKSLDDILADRDDLVEDEDPEDAFAEDDDWEPV